MPTQDLTIELLLNFPYLSLENIESMSRSQIIKKLLEKNPIEIEN
jgi:hypothetical protein